MRPVAHKPHPDSSEAEVSFTDFADYRSPQKPPPQRGLYHNGDHASTAKILALRNAEK